MAAAVYGKVDSFDSKKEDFQLYVERLNHYFVANSITEEGKKRAIFCTVVGETTYKLLRSLIHPTKVEDKTYAELCDVLLKHFRPTPPRQCNALNSILELGSKASQ